MTKTNGVTNGVKAKSLTRRPLFDELPLRKGDPRRSAWGLYGQDDQLGTLNLLAESAVLAGAQEVKHGIVVPLNLPMDVPSTPFNPARRKVEHTILSRGHCHDDEVLFNTQSSTQIDGFRHYPYQRTLQYYGGAVDADFAEPARLGVQHLAEHGITGRAVLLDFATWAESRGISVDAFAPYAITVADLQAVACYQGVSFQAGDILLIRTGWTAQYRALARSEQDALGKRDVRAFVGIEQGDEMLRWLWTNAFSMVASDTNAVERWPPPDRFDSLHEVLLAGWGMPLGELWDLERLASECRRLGKYSFLLACQPMNLPGGVASPANAQAIL